MRSVLNVLKGPYTMIRTFHYYYGEFGFKIALYKALVVLVHRYQNTRAHRFVYSTMNRIIYDFLINELKPLVEEYINIKNCTPTPEGLITPVIWQSWWQGKGELVGITKMCTDSVFRHSSGVPVKFVDKDNYKQYVEIPDKIMNWLHDGRISYTHFADYLRMSLLNQNGGIWFDCAIYVSKDIDRNTLQHSFYSPKGIFRDYRHISLDMWSTGCMACAKGFPMMDLYVRLFEAYFEKHNKLIDYYLTDFFMRIAYEYIGCVRTAVDEVPYNNPEKHTLTPLLSEPYNEKKYEDLIQDTAIFKLSRKVPSRKITRSRKQTFYGKLLKDYSLD